MPRGEGTKKISDLFEKYRRTLHAPQGSVITAFCEVVKDLYGWDIEKKHISFNVISRTLSVVVTGPLKSEIKLKKEEILTHLKGRLGKHSAPKEII